ncbi:GntR family transcriptional regulator [Vibrio sp. PP-XX7]
MAALYLSIASTLRHEVRDHYLAGEYLPPEKQLAARFAVNRHTLRRALDELVDDGLIIRQQGIGNQVAKPKVFYVLDDKASYTQNLSASGMRADTFVLGCREATLNPVTAKRLGRRVDQAYVLLTTQRHLNGCVACVIHHHLFDIDIEQLRLFLKDHCTSF